MTGQVGQMSKYRKKGKGNVINIGKTGRIVEAKQTESTSGVG
jgi:hypothetical protein